MTYAIERIVFDVWVIIDCGAEKVEECLDDWKN